MHITYLLAKEIMHRLSVGSEWAIRPGKMKWMTAGTDITHLSALRSCAPTAIDGIQTWVALPNEREEMNPGFSPSTKNVLPVLDDDGVSDPWSPCA
ncbi:pirin family protein [Luteimonas sp. A277]